MFLQSPKHGSAIECPSDCLQIPGYGPIIRLDRHQRVGGAIPFYYCGGTFGNYYSK